MALSRLKQGFESPRERQLKSANQNAPHPRGFLCPHESLQERRAELRMPPPIFCLLH
ncbi:hypothetical protein STPYR_10836 [uncultured Stenotrophomonas sp.]|uniref:Uncharacterized protein n=1 Tax=uncultured Stenotrophomonas sp. TaxID=165438 RepID=A0A1Y5Q4T9_9GAMM|nr:hypothetical protein STPYR_10836 [uncultured Stenotrophomonas sp.]